MVAAASDSNRPLSGATVALVQSPALSKKDLTEVTEILTEKYTVYEVILIPAVDALLYASDRTTALLCHIGHSRTQIVPVFDGFMLPETEVSGIVSGNAVTMNIESIFQAKGTQLGYSSRPIVEDIKHKLCFVSLNPNKEPDVVKNYELPDGDIIEVGSERYEGPEVLFTPRKIYGSEEKGLVELIAGIIKRCPIDVKRPLLENIFLTGGTAALPGLNIRLAQDVSPHVSALVTARIIVPRNPHEALWQGASRLVQLKESQIADRL